MDLSTEYMEIETDPVSEAANGYLDRLEERSQNLIEELYGGKFGMRGGHFMASMAGNMALFGAAIADKVMNVPHSHYSIGGAAAGIIVSGIFAYIASEDKSEKVEVSPDEQ